MKLLEIWSRELVTRYIFLTDAQSSGDEKTKWRKIKLISMGKHKYKGKGKQDPHRQKLSKSAKFENAWDGSAHFESDKNEKARGEGIVRFIKMSLVVNLC